MLSALTQQNGVHSGLEVLPPVDIEAVAALWCGKTVSCCE